jgi:predicted PurR-regulated permease PerM
MKWLMNQSISFTVSIQRFIVDLLLFVGLTFLILKSKKALEQYFTPVFVLKQVRSENDSSSNYV